MTAEFELIDLVDYPLPHPDEPLPPNMGAYQNRHTLADRGDFRGRSLGIAPTDPQPNDQL